MVSGTLTIGAGTCEAPPSPSPLPGDGEGSGEGVDVDVDVAAAFVAALVGEASIVVSGVLCARAGAVMKTRTNSAPIVDIKRRQSLAYRRSAGRRGEDAPAINSGHRHHYPSGSVTESRITNRLFRVQIKSDDGILRGLLFKKSIRFANSDLRTNHTLETIALRFFHERRSPG